MKCPLTETAAIFDLHCFRPVEVGRFKGLTGWEQVWLTSHLWGVALRKDGRHAREVPSRVQTGRGYYRKSG